MYFNASTSDDMARYFKTQLATVLLRTQLRTLLLPATSVSLYDPAQLGKMAYGPLESVHLGNHSNPHHELIILCLTPHEWFTVGTCVVKGHFLG